MPQQTKKPAKKDSRASSSSGTRSGTSRSPNGHSRAAGARSRTTTRRRNGSSSTRSTASKRPSSRASSGGRNSRSNRPDSSKSPVASATETASKGVKNAGSAIGDVAQKAKVPALAAGAGLAGLAGGIAVARNSRKRVLGVRMPTKRGSHAVSKNLAEATKNVRSFGEGMESLAGEVRRVREGFVGAAAGNAGGVGENRRSPIEVVLQGLTRRR
jgi:hypothetical protein